MKQVQHTQDIFLLPGFTNPNYRNCAEWSHEGVNTARILQCIHERVHMKEAVFGAYDQSRA